MLVEAFPAAQLRAWQLPYGGYSKPEQQGVRELILAGLAERLEFTASQHTLMLKSPDALNAVIAAFAAIAADQQQPLDRYPADGLIAIFDDTAA